MVMFAGIRIHEDPHHTVIAEDWSEVRSRARAARRRRQGHPQRIRWVQTPRPAVYVVGDILICHPDQAAQIRAQIEAWNG